MDTALFLLRHGLTAANLEKRFAGRTDEPLHPEGMAQINALGRQLGHEGITRIVTGPLTRARQTAEILGGLLGLSTVVAEALNEIYIPHWDGLTKQAIRDRFGPEYPAWLAHPEQFFISGCETLADVQMRAVDGVEEMVSRYQGETILVVSHLIVLRCLLLHYRQLPLQHFRAIHVANGALYRLTRTRNGATVWVSH